MKLAAVAILLVPSLALPAWADEEVTFANVPTPDVESISIEQPQGKLELNGWDKREVRVVAHKHARDDKTLDQLTVEFVMARRQDAHPHRRARRRHLPPAAGRRAARASI